MWPESILDKQTIFDLIFLFVFSAQILHELVTSGLFNLFAGYWVEIVHECCTLSRRLGATFRPFSIPSPLLEEYVHARPESSFRGTASHAFIQKCNGVGEIVADEKSPLKRAFLI